MVRWSPKGSITSKKLADALAYIDSLDLFPRDNGRNPFLLLDGHNSSEEHNVSYKIALSRAKKNMLHRKLSLHLHSPQLCPTDIITLINEAWAFFFARVSMNKNAIAERGWGPLNRNLLF